MSDRRVVPTILSIVTLALALPAETARAQDLAEWQRRLREQSAAVGAASEAYKASSSDKRVYDRILRVDGLAANFASGDLPAGDSAAIERGFRQALDALRAHHGEAGVALARGGHWTVARQERATRRTRQYIRFERVSEPSQVTGVFSPVNPDEVERIVLGYAGDRLARTTPGLAPYNGYSVLQPDRVPYAEIARRIATSWAGAARRCAAGAIDACAAVLAPFDAKGEATRYFDPADFRAVVASAHLPALGDSLYFDARRRCVRGEDSVCVRVIERLDLPDPFNPQVRGTLLAHAIEIGGEGALARAAESRDSTALEVVARIADVPADSLLASWRTRVFDALDEDRAKTGAPLLLSSLIWGVLLLAVSTKRRYL